jgi:hypothetical protein
VSVLARNAGIPPRSCRADVIDPGWRRFAILSSVLRPIALLGPDATEQPRHLHAAEHELKAEILMRARLSGVQSIMGVDAASCGVDIAQPPVLRLARHLRPAYRFCGSDRRTTMPSTRSHWLLR